MKRREFLTLLSAGVAWPTMVRAQQAKVARIAYLGPSMGVPGFVIGTIRRRLRELGWEEGRNLAIDERVYGPDLGEVAPAAADFLRTRVDVIIVVSTNVARVVQSVTNAIPIVVVSGSDPVAAGVAASLARPGGMVTGLSMMSPEMVAKRAELLVQILYNPNPNTRSAPYLLEAILPAMETLGLTHRTFPARTSDEIDPAFDAIKQWSADGVVVLDDPVLLVLRTKIAGAALARKLPVACPFREMAQAGCLFTYSASLPERFERGAAYVDKILRGANPAELPFEQPTKLELVVNLITAKALGIEIPDILLATADQVIE
jgi:putative ABC transport system substrate-binding protein